jgi:hypothetical protein
MSNEENKKGKSKETGITKFESKIPSISTDKLDAVIDLSDDQTSWLKIIEGGFKVINQDKFVKGFTGRIVSVEPHLMKFENNTPHKLPHVADDLDIPEGYERRCDVKLLMDDQLIGLSLAPSSMKYYLSPYLKFLRNKDLRPEEVLTKVTSKQASNDKGTWSVAAFELVGEPQDTSPEPPQAVSGRIPKGWE